MTTSATTGQDGHLVDALNILQCPRRQGMSALVVGSDLLFLLRNHLGLTAWSTHDAVGGFFQCVSGNDIAANTRDRKSTRLNSSHVAISYAVFCLKKKITRISTDS